jgi:hypothetical protein
MRLHLAFFVLAIGAAPAAMAACSVKDKEISDARFFALTSGEGAWREYQSLDQVPHVALDSGMTAEYVQQRKSSASVTLVAPGQHFWTYTRYCFDEHGRLEGMSLELRTPLGWGYRMEGTVRKSEFSAGAPKFFRTKNGRSTAKPEGVAAAPANLKPTVYLKVSELPFASLLNPGAIPDQKRGSKVTVASSDN